MAGNNRKKAAPKWEQPQPLTLVPEEVRKRLLSDYNHRWKKGPVHLLRNCPEARDMSAFVYFGKDLYAVSFHVVCGLGNPVDDGLGYLRVFGGKFPAVIDMTDVKPDAAGQPKVPVTQELQAHIIERLRTAHMAVVHEVTGIFRQSLKGVPLKEIVRQLKPFQVDGCEGFFHFGPVCAPVADMLAASPAVKEAYPNDSVRNYMVGAVLEGSVALLPAFLGTDYNDAHSSPVCWASHTAGNGRRSWARTRGGGIWCGNIRERVRLKEGPLAVVCCLPGSAEEGREYCDRLLASRAYGDVILLEGQPEQTRTLAGRVSEYFFGIDTLEV